MDKILNNFPPIMLEEMSGIKLMNRIDTKFVTTRPRLLQLLRMLEGDYLVQEIDGAWNMPYDTIYWDTEHYDMYNAHQTGRANRQKLRFRTYLCSDLQFMEVKSKNNHGRTKKKRMEVKDMQLDEASKADFLHQYLHYEIEALRPTIQNRFDRVTLVNRNKTERLTIDTNLRFQNLVSGKGLDMRDLVIIELKREGLCYSPVLEKLCALHIRPHGFSKYCMGSALTNEALNVNRFKRKLIEIDKIRRAV